MTGAPRIDLLDTDEREAIESCAPVSMMQERTLPGFYCIWQLTSTTPARPVRKGMQTGAAHEGFNDKNKIATNSLRANRIAPFHYDLYRYMLYQYR